MKEGEGGEERRKGARPCLEMGSLTGILMCLNLCISSVCSPERGVGETERERGEGGEGERKGCEGGGEEEEEGGNVEEEKSKTMAD